MTTFQKAELLKRLQRLDFDMRLRRYPAVLEAAEAREEEPADDRDAEEFFLAEQCPSDASFL